MREILFKAKRWRDGKWVYGDLNNLQDSVIIHWYNNGCRVSDEVDPSTVCQYTGLTDKNGKKIFEGDVLKIAKKSDGLGAYFFPPLEYPVNVMVKWDMCAWMWETLGEDKYYISFPNAWCHYECEVIGNIHDGEGGQYEGGRQ
jgi:uncharacterized phage protein (TIGR01671 family)|nr:MAG TPA: YopX protein [Caudoviricetes sp.]